MYSWGERKGQHFARGLTIFFFCFCTRAFPSGHIRLPIDKAGSHRKQQTMSEDSIIALTENGAAGYKLDAWCDFLAKTFPDTEAEDVRQRFSRLYEEDPRRAFKYAMLLGNLRKGGGGRGNMNGFVACMDVVWEKNPMHVVVNVANIMELVSAKMMLVSHPLSKLPKLLLNFAFLPQVLLKHFSNPSPQHRNNYWGNLQAIKDLEERRATFRSSHAVKQERRKRRFEGHFAVVQEFARSLGFGCVWSVVQRKPSLCQEPRRYVVQVPYVLVPRSEMVAERWAAFLQEDHSQEDEAQEYCCQEAEQEDCRTEGDEESGDGGCEEEHDEERLRKKTLRNRLRSIAYREDAFGPGHRWGKRDLYALADKFAARYADDAELAASIPPCKEDEEPAAVDKKKDPIEFVSDFGMLTDECSDAETDSNGADEDPCEDGPPFLKFFEDEMSVPVTTCTTKRVGTKPSMNPLSGYEVLPELKDRFAAFVAARDARLKAEAKASRNECIRRERASEQRCSNEALALLFDATVETFVHFMRGEGQPHALRMSGFKYCPTPGCSADKATGSLESGGIGEAMMRRLGFASGMSPTGGRREFKVGTLFSFFIFAQRLPLTLSMCVNLVCRSGSRRTGLPWAWPSRGLAGGRSRRSTTPTCRRATPASGWGGSTGATTQRATIFSRSRWWMPSSRGREADARRRRR